MENSVLANPGEMSFFGDRSFTTTEKLWKHPNNGTKNSSNPEKIYENLNSEIQRVTDEASKLLDFNISNKTISDQLPNNDPILDLNIWNESTNEHQDISQYYKKYELWKKRFKKLQKEPLMKGSKQNSPDVKAEAKIKTDSSENDIEDEIGDEVPIIQKINTIDIKSNSINQPQASVSSNNIKQLCVTEPSEDNSYRNYSSYIETLNINQHNNTPQQLRMTDNMNYYMFPQPQRNLFGPIIFSGNNNNTAQLQQHQGSILSTQYSSNGKIRWSNEMSCDETEWNEQMNEQTTGRPMLNFTMNYNDFHARVPTNESNNSNKSTSRYNNTNYNIQLNNWRDFNNKRIYSSSFNGYNGIHTISSGSSSISNTNNNISKISNNNTNPNPSNCKTGQCNKNPKQSSYTPMNNERQTINLSNIALGKDKKTTVMIRNIPIKYNDDMLIKEWEKFENKFDCLYMPYDFEKQGNKGYAFINFTDPWHILLFYEVFQGKAWTYFESKKICELNFGNFQGINEIKKHARNYKGKKKPTFFIITNQLKNKNIEIPEKFLPDLLERFPKLSYFEKKQSGTFMIKNV